MIKRNDYIIIHHTLVSREKNDEQFDAVDNYHRSLGWGKIGYSVFIEQDGTVKKGRGYDEAGAHCSQKLMNYRSIGICLAGNFDIEDPTTEQIEVLYRVVNELRVVYNIPVDKVLPHRHFATYKSCPGNRLTDSFIQEVAVGYISNPVSEWAKESVAWCKETGIATNFDFPQNPVTKEEMAVMLHRYHNLKDV